MPWKSDDLTQIPDGNGFRYELRGRSFILSSRCDLCGEHGKFADTGCCPQCEEDVPKKAELIRRAARCRAEGDALAGAGEK